MKITISSASQDELEILIRLLHISKFAPDEQRFFVGHPLFQQIIEAATGAYKDVVGEEKMKKLLTTERVHPYMRDLIVEQSLCALSAETVSVSDLDNFISIIASPRILTPALKNQILELINERASANS